MVLVDGFMDQLYLLIRDKSKKQEGSHRVAAEIVSGMIRGSKNWTIEMVCQNILPLMKNDHLFLAR